MGWKKGGDEPSSPPSLSDALLFTTLCIVGLPVEVQVKDGSIYSGIFHTASADKGYGIVLNKARKTGRGKGDTNLEMGSLIDTLVVLSDDLVQVVVKDFLLPEEGIVGNVVGIDIDMASGAVEPRAFCGDSEREPRSFISANGAPLRYLDKNEENKSLCGRNRNENLKVHGGHNERKVLAYLENAQEVDDASEGSLRLKKAEEPCILPSVPVKERQVGEDRKQGEKGSYNHIDMVSVEDTVVLEVHCSSPIPYASLPLVNSVDETPVDISSKKTSNEEMCGSPAAIPVRPEVPESKFPISTNSTLSDAHTFIASTSVSVNKFCSYPSQSTSTNPSSPRVNSICNTSAKEFKLNPGAKVFLPSSKSAPDAWPTVSSTDFLSNIGAVMPIAVAPSSLEINSSASRSSIPTKLVQNNNLLAGHNDVSAQYSLPIVGHAGARQQPIRFSGQFHPLQAGPTYVHPNSQTVMVGRLGQLMYVHPVPQDAIQGTSVLSQGSPHPLLTPYQAHVPKLQGTAAQSLQFCMAPPPVAGGGQPYAVPSHLPFAQPFPAIGPIPISGGNAFFRQ